jgi:hypothetical protein
VFADWVDAILPPPARLQITNALDPVPMLPFEVLGYRTPATGQVHITRAGEWVACEDDTCAVFGFEEGDGEEEETRAGGAADWADIWHFDIVDHCGPYDGVWMGCAGESLV